MAISRMQLSIWPICVLAFLVLASTTQTSGYSKEPKPFRPSQQIDGIEHKNFQFGRQSHFVGQIQLPNIYQQTGFVGQNVLPSVQQTTFVNPSTSVSSSHQTTFVGQNNSPVPQQLSDFVGQVFSPVSQQSHFVEQIKAPISYQPSFVEQGHQPTVVGENITPNHRLNPLLVPQQTSPVVGHNVRQNEFIDHNENKNYNRHTTSSPISKQIDFLDIDFGESTFHESRQNLGRRKNSTSFRHFDDDDEIDTPSDRIYRGWELDPHEFPWMVKLMATFPYGNRRGYVKRRYCGGALISDRWVLTARHCVTWHPPEQQGRRRNIQTGISAIGMKVYLGSHGFFGEDGEQMRADRAVGREDYGRPQCSTPGDWCLKRVARKTFFPWTLFTANLRRDSVGPPPKQDDIFTNDIALVRLTKPVRMSRKIHPVKLPSVSFDYLNYRAYVSGWGIESPQHQGPSKSLKAAEMIVVDGTKYEGCSVQSGWGKMCAKSFTGSEREGSACPGDSGSPLVTWDQNNGGWTLIGLLSNGAKSCFEGNPEIYTKVGDYLPWIYDTMRRSEHEVP